MPGWSRLRTTARSQSCAGSRRGAGAPVRGDPGLRPPARQADRLYWSTGSPRLRLISSNCSSGVIATVSDTRVRGLPGVAGIMGSMRTRLGFVRHGESVHSVDAVVGGRQGCRGLTAAGHEQARELAERLADELAADGPVAVYSSVLRRAVETAQPIAAALAATVVQDCGLCTWHTPSYADGMPTTRFQADHAAPGGGVYRLFEKGNERAGRTGRTDRPGDHRHCAPAPGQHRGTGRPLRDSGELISCVGRPTALLGLRPDGSAGLDHRLGHRRRSHQVATTSLDPAPLQRRPLRPSSRRSIRSDVRICRLRSAAFALRTPSPHLGRGNIR
jgi:hypothetical protein